MSVVWPSRLGRRCPSARLVSKRDAMYRGTSPQVSRRQLSWLSVLTNTKKSPAVRTNSKVLVDHLAHTINRFRGPATVEFVSTVLASKCKESCLPVVIHDWRLQLMFSYAPGIQHGQCN